MVEPTRRPELEHNSGFEADEGPEEVTLSLGREKAQDLRKEERENKRRVQAEASQRRLRSAVKKNEEMRLDEQETAPVAESFDEAFVNPAHNNHDFNLSKPAKISGFLDTSIVKFLSAQEKKVGEASPSPPEDEDLQMPRRTGKRKGYKLNTSSSRVSVVLLKDDPPLSAHRQNALEFKQKRLYGERMRSVNMLSAKR